MNRKFVTTCYCFRSLHHINTTVKKALVASTWHRSDGHVIIINLNTLCPTSRLDVMSHAATIQRACFAAIPYTARAFNGNSPEIRNLPFVISRLISKFDRESCKLGV